jgi:hypothetical protein
MCKIADILKNAGKDAPIMRRQEKPDYLGLSGIIYTDNGLKLKEWKPHFDKKS